MSMEISETKTEVTFRLRGAASIQTEKYGRITPMRVTLTTFAGLGKPDSARSFVEVAGPSTATSIPGEHRTQKYNIFGTSAPDISTAPIWIRSMVGYDH